MIAFLWRATRGHRLRPWRSPYLRWRIETYSGIPAERIGFREFWGFGWGHRADLLRYLRWVKRNTAPSRSRLGNSVPLQSRDRDGAV